MIYKLNCPWHDQDGAIEQAPNMADAAAMFCSKIYGEGWQNAAVNESTDRKSAIITASGRRPFRVDIYNISNRKIEINKKPSSIGKIKVDAIAVSCNGEKSVGFVTTARNAAISAHAIGADKKTIVRLLQHRGRVGFVDIVGNGDSLEILKSQMVAAGAKHIVLR